MSTIVIKTEKDEDEQQPQAKVGGGGNGSAKGGVVANAVGQKAVVEKTQAALKVATEAKQLNLRLKDQNLLLQPQHKQPSNAYALGASATTTPKRSLPGETNSNYNVANKRFRVEAPTRYLNQQKTPSTAPALKPAQKQGASSRCGEIFVTNNARKWTFVCTFCQKTTRDIGEFVCHIKYKHMPPDQYYEEDENEGDETMAEPEDFPINQEDDEAYNNQDYFDCANYLDVNVHTEADELPNNNGVTPKSISKAKRLANNPKETPKQNIPTNKYVVNLLDEEEEDEHDNDEAQVKGEQLFDYKMEDEDEEGVEIIDDENNDEMMEGMDDSSLLFLRSSSIEDAAAEPGSGGAGGNKNVNKKYRSHVRGKAYCNLCDKTFQYYSLYRNHMIKHSNITPYKCQYCSKAFKSKQAIRYHMNTHTKEVQYSCPICPTTYGTENQFITHVLNHESETCFPCMVCAKILNSDQEREEHLTTHSEERPFGCTICNKRFRQKHHLSNHMKLHCHYRCDFCKEEFASTQTQRRPYACASCEEYPEIRIQVEKQRSKTINNSSEVNPLELAYEADNTECVDLATDDEENDNESETSNGLLAGGGSGQKRYPCQHCTRSYKQNSALYYHIRQKHPNAWLEKKSEIYMN